MNRRPRSPKAVTAPTPPAPEAAMPPALTPEFRFALLVQQYAVGHAVEVDAVDVLDCALAIPTGVVPRLASLAELARDFVHAFACGEADGLPPDLKCHVEKWMVEEEAPVN